MRQEIRFVTSSDGTRIAWARHGHGPPLVRVATWLTNLEADWTSPIWKHWLTDLGDRFTVIRYDDRGSGLSDRSPAVSGEPAPWKPAVCAAHMNAPSLFVIARDDEMPGADPSVARTAFDSASSPKELLEIEGGHFGLLHYPSALFDEVSQAQLSFLVRHLG